MAWFNSDGLLVKFGYEEAQVGGGGEFKWVGPSAQLEIDVRWNMLNAFGTRTILDETVRIPNGLLVESAVFEVVDAFTSGGAATLSFGFYAPDRTTAQSATGLVNATALATINAIGAKVTGAGSQVGTILGNATPNLVSATVGTANYTAGRGVLRLTLFKPVRAPKIVGALA